MAKAAPVVVVSDARARLDIARDRLRDAEVHLDVVLSGYTPYGPMTMALQDHERLNLEDAFHRISENRKLIEEVMRGVVDRLRKRTK